MAKADTDKDRIESAADKVSVFLAWSGKVSQQTAFLFKVFPLTTIVVLDMLYW